MDDEDKFQYLIQATASGTTAREIVYNFPPTAENYANAIDSLKSRFGREKLLIELYVRELLGLVIKNATETKSNVNTAQVYDKLESYLRDFRVNWNDNRQVCRDVILPLRDKQEVLKGNKCCFTCLKTGHRSKECKTNVSCLVCAKTHWAVTCPGIPINQVKAGEDEPQKVEGKQNAAYLITVVLKRYYFKPCRCLLRPVGKDVK